MSTRAEKLLLIYLNKCGNGTAFHERVQNTGMHLTAGTGGIELFETLLEAFLGQLKMGGQLKIKQNVQPSPVWALHPAQVTETWCTP